MARTVHRRAGEIISSMPAGQRQPAAESPAPAGIEAPIEALPQHANRCFGKTTLDHNPQVVFLSLVRRPH
jgi:hypothetical protein